VAWALSFEGEWGHRWRRRGQSFKLPRTI